MVLKVCPVVCNQDETKINNPNVEQNMTSSVYVESSKKPSPFASKKIMRQRNHHSDSHEHSLGDEEVQVVPGSREEIMEFVENTNATAKVFLDINLPYLFVTLPSKHIYETIYNRFVLIVTFFNFKYKFLITLLFLDLPMICSFGLHRFPPLHLHVEEVQIHFHIYRIELVILHLLSLE